MQDQFILDPVQHFDFHLNALNECARISKRVLGGEYTPSRSQRILIEKSKGLCRQLVIPHVDDALVLQCLSDGLFLAISANAPTTKSFYAPQDHPFSKNLLAAERYYGSFQAWLNFQRSIFNFSKRYRYIVVTDIGNYYDSISYSHLRNVISSVAKAPEHLMDLLLYVLAGLLWKPDYMPRVEVGLPQINLDAPRLLAHAFLYELDTFLSQTPGIDFARYMDDIDIGVDSVPAAKVVLRDVDLVLQTRQVRLNSGKTQILTSAEASRHFRIAENAQLDTLTREIERRSRAGMSLRKQTASVERQLRRGLARGSFEGGNGEKILKRLLTLARRTTAPIPERDLEYVLRMWPGSRENVFEYLAARELTTSTARTLLSFLQSGIVVDDASRILMVNWLNHTRAPRRVGPERYLRRIADELSEDGFFGIYSKLWILSKYGTTDELLEVVRRTQPIWNGDHRLGRLVGGLRPLFENSPRYADLQRLIARSRNASASETWRFHGRLSQDAATFKGMYNALKSPNVSKATGITHPKFLLLLSALRNQAAPLAQRKTLVRENRVVWRDYFYRRWARRVARVYRFV